MKQWLLHVPFLKRQKISVKLCLKTLIKREVLNFRGKLFQSLLAITEKERPASSSFPQIEWCSKTQVPTSQTAQTDHS